MSRPDERIDMTDEPDHDELCERDQRYLPKAMSEDLDLSAHMNDGGEQPAYCFGGRGAHPFGRSGPSLSI